MNNNIPFEILNLIFSYVPRSETFKIIDDKIKRYERFRDEHDDELTFSNFCLTYEIYDKGFNDFDDEEDEFDKNYDRYIEYQMERYYNHIYEDEYRIEYVKYMEDQIKKHYS